MPEETKKSTFVARLLGDLAEPETRRAVNSIRAVMPTITDKTLARYIAAGFVGEKLEMALDLVKRHKSSLSHIVRWNQKVHLTMPRIKLCLGIRDEYGDYGMSVAVISRYLTNLGFSEFSPTEVEEIPDTVMDVFDMFLEIADRLGGDYPFHRIWHRVEEEFGSNIQDAYQMAVLDEDLFIKVVRHELSRTAAQILMRQGESDSFDDVETFAFDDGGNGGYRGLDQYTQRFVEESLRYQQD